MMEACKKYWNEEVKPYIHNPADREVFDAGWRNALKWVDAFLTDSVDDRVTHYLIKRELEGK